MHEVKDSIIVYKAEEIQEYKKWMKEIPSLKFQEDWNVKIIPPFAGAVVRFQVTKGDAWVSVYLDCYDSLGLFGSPYWEIYPYYDDTYRCAMNKTEDLIEKIKESIENQIKINLNKGETQCY